MPQGCFASVHCLTDVEMKTDADAPLGTIDVNSNLNDPRNPLMRKTIEDMDDFKRR